jgi:hypothetical protein
VATPRLRLPARALASGALALAAWAAFAALAPTVLGIDHRGLIDIKGAGDKTALNLALHNGVRYPLTHLVLYASLAGALALAAMWVARNGKGSGAGAAEPGGRPGRLGSPLAAAGAQPDAVLAVLTLHFAACSALQTTT